MVCCLGVQVKGRSVKDGPGSPVQRLFGSTEAFRKAFGLFSRSNTCLREKPIVTACVQRPLVVFPDTVRSLPRWFHRWFLRLVWASTRVLVSSEPVPGFVSLLSLLRCAWSSLDEVPLSVGALPATAHILQFRTDSPCFPLFHPPQNPRPEPEKEKRDRGGRILEIFGGL